MKAATTPAILKHVQFLRDVNYELPRFLLSTTVLKFESGELDDSHFTKDQTLLQLAPDTSHGTPLEPQIGLLKANTGSRSLVT